MSNSLQSKEKAVKSRCLLWKKLICTTVTWIIVSTCVAQTITTYAGTGTAGYNGDGITGTSAQLWYPLGVFLDASGNVYIADDWNHRIRKVTASTGIITTIAGTGVGGFSGDGGPATSAQLFYPTSVAVDASGDVYIAEEGNNRIRKITTSTGTINTIAGIGGFGGFSGDGGPATAAQFGNGLYGISVDAAGNVWPPPGPSPGGEGSKCHTEKVVME